MEDADKRRRWLAPLGVAAVATLARGARAILEDQLFNDGPRFIRVGEAFLAGDWQSAVTHVFHPLTGLMMAGLAALTGIDLEAAGRLISVASGPLAAVAVFLLARELCGERVALVSGLLFAVHPRLVAVGSNVQSDGLHAALVLVGAYAAWRALAGGRVGPALAAGVATGLAYLARPEGLMVAPVLVGWLAVDALRGRLPWRRVLAIGAAFALAAAAVATPYLLALRSATGSWTLTQKKGAAEILTLETAGAHSPGSWQSPAERLGAALAELATDGYRAATPAYFVLGLLGLSRGTPTRGTRYLLSYVGLMGAVLFGLHLHASYVSRRHWLVLVAFALPFVARGLIRTVEMIDAAVLARYSRRVATGVLAGAFAVGFVHAAVPGAEPVKSARQEAAVWLRENAPPGAVAASRFRISYYSGATRFVRVFGSSHSRSVLDEARSGGADYLVIEASELGSPPAEALHGVVPLHRVEYSGGEVLVLALRGGASAP